MTNPSTWRKFIHSDLAVLILIALVRILIQSITNQQYGWHRDELAMLDDSRHLAWGFVAYPPVTPFIGRVALTLFGPSMVGVRLFAVLAMAAASVLTGLMVRELGGRRFAQIAAALAVTLSPMALAAGNLFQYVAFDYLWCVLLAYLIIRLLKSEDPRWWVGIGAVIGLGMMTKSTMAIYVAGIVLGVLFTRRWQWLRSPWLWGGVGLALLIFLPNLIWQIQHQFISVDFLSSIHARDVRIGRTSGFVKDQFMLQLNLLTLLLDFAGLYFYFFAPSGRQYRMIGWMYLVSLVILLLTQGRGYYLMPAYPMLIAGGAYFGDQWLRGLPENKARWVRGAAFASVLIFGVVAILLVMPLAPVNSPLFEVTSSLNSDLVEEIGWPEMVHKVAEVYQTLPAEEKTRAGILAANNGEAGALNLYGPAYGLPQAISGVDSYWVRGYGSPPPQTVIALGFPGSYITTLFETCDPAGRFSNAYNVLNEEMKGNPDIYICRHLRQPWPEFWKNFKFFG